MDDKKEGHYKNILEMLHKHHQGIADIIHHAITGEGPEHTEDHQEDKEENDGDSKTHAPGKALAIPTIEKPESADSISDADEKDNKIKNWFKRGR